MKSYSSLTTLACIASLIAAADADAVAVQAGEIELLGPQSYEDSTFFPDDSSVNVGAVYVAEAGNGTDNTDTMTQPLVLAAGGKCNSVKSTTYGTYTYTAGAPVTWSQDFTCVFNWSIAPSPRSSVQLNVNGTAPAALTNPQALAIAQAAAASSCKFACH
jgi:hypothetical protein